MLLRLFLLFTVVPIVELYLLIEIGRRIGAAPTVGIVVVTALLGAVLARSQGMRAWRRFTGILRSGEAPGDAIMNGIAVLIGATLLVTPGLVTDVVAIALLFPPTRAPLVRSAQRRIERRLRRKGGEIEARFWYRDRDL